MKIEYRIGDILDADETILLQGCNAQGVMGSGLAKAIMDRHPGNFPAYRRAYVKQGNRLELGQIIPHQCDDGHVIWNAITQEFYGRNPDILYVSYDAIRTVIRTISDRFPEPVHLPPQRIALPLIGAGLANGDWSIIEGIIEDESVNFQPVVYVTRNDLRKMLRSGSYR